MATLGRVRIGIHEIATGPVHYDYGYDGSGGRVFLDIKMSQIVRMKMRPLGLTVNFDEMPTSPLFCYNFNIVVSL